MERIAIVGTGLIGRGWAIVFARAGHSVKLWDNDTSAMPKAIGLIEEALREMHGFGLVKEPPHVIAARITIAATLAEALRDADYVQENTAERVDVKGQVYAQMDAIAPANCILASSTSTIPTSVFSKDLKGKHRCIVAHPANPPHVLPIVEISPAPWTSPEVIERTTALQKKVGQSTVVIKKEVQGFVLNRLQAALMNEAWRLVKEDYVTVDDLDKCLKDGLGLRWSFMGPFETIDLNAPGGVLDYAQKYGPVFYQMMKDVQPIPWDEVLATKVTAERRKVMSQEQHAEREAWRDRRLMTLVAHKREMAKEE